MRLIAKNWAEFQHYKDRNPPWIRLHKKLIDDMDFQMLPVASRALAPMLWLLASESMNGEIDGDTKKIAFRLRQSVAEIEDALKPLIDNGFFVMERDASNVIAGGLHGAVPETETETETETDKNKLTLVPGFRDAQPSDQQAADSENQKQIIPIPDCPHGKIIDLWAEILPDLTQSNRDTWEGARAGNLRARWRWLAEKNGWRTVPEGLEDFAAAFKHVRSSEFLMGRAKVPQGKQPFELTLDWLVCPNNWLKFVDGKYHKKRSAA